MGTVTRTESAASQGTGIPLELLEAIAAKEPVSGHTHNFYRILLGFHRSLSGK